jgi:hypothetical protein
VTGRIRRLWELVNREPGPDGRIPRAIVLDETPAAVELERDTRIRHAANRIDILLALQARLFHDDRNTELVDALLELRSTLRPAVADPEALRELPTAPIRPAAARWAA